MGIEGLVGFDSNLQPKDDGRSFVRRILVPGSYVAKALSLHKSTLKELESVVFETTQLQNKAATAELIINPWRAVASDVYGALIGEAVRLAAYAMLVYTLFKGISDLAH